MNVAKSTFQEGARMNGLRSTMGIYGFHKLFLNTPIRPGIIRSGMKLSLLTKTLYSCRVKEAIHIRLHPNNINRDSGIEIPEAWMPTVRQHDNLSPPQRTAEGSVSSSHNANNALDRNPPTMSQVCNTTITNNHSGTNSLTQ